MSGTKVFISSTYRDNQDRRKLVEDAVLRAGMQPYGMERFAASPYPPKDECLRLVKESDLFVGILSWRYGWIQTRWSAPCWSGSSIPSISRWRSGSTRRRWSS